MPPPTRSDVATPATAPQRRASAGRTLLDAVRRLFIPDAAEEEATGESPVAFRRPSRAAAGARPGRPPLAGGGEVVKDAPPSDEDCPICLSPLEANCVVTPCDHRYHRACLDQCFVAERGPKMRCPVCRASVTAKRIVEAESASGRQIEVIGLPAVNSRCHVDRGYTFDSLGGFARLNPSSTFYLFTPNNDRHTRVEEVMWTINTTVPTTIHLNFRSAAHVTRTGVAEWLRASGWLPNTSIRSTVSSGVPNGPYSGPVFSKAHPPGRIRLMGSNTWEGVYFVFVETHAEGGPSSAAAESDPSAAAMAAADGSSETQAEGGPSAAADGVAADSSPDGAAEAEAADERGARDPALAAELAWQRRQMEARWLPSEAEEGEGEEARASEAVSPLAAAIADVVW